MKINGQTYEIGQIVQLTDTKNRKFVGYIFKPMLIQRVFKLPFEKEVIIGLSPIDLRTLDTSLNPTKIITTLENMFFKWEGIPTSFKEEDIRDILLLDIIDDGITEALRHKAS